MSRAAARKAVLGVMVFLSMYWVGCGSGSSGSTQNNPATPSSPNPANPAGTPTAQPASSPLNAGNLNLVFVVSEDLSYQASGDINLGTANLTDQGLDRTLMMATFLRRQVLGANNVTAIYSLEPMTHLQTAGNYPDLVALETIQQFALLNQITLSTASSGTGSQYTANSYPVNASYAPGAVPGAVATPPQFCQSCQGLDFIDQGGDNETLATGIIKANIPGFYVFSAPWEAVSSLLANINKLEGYDLTLPATYQGPNYIYAISITPSGSASLATYNSNAAPSAAYPALPSPVPVSSACTAQKPFSLTVTGGSGGAVVPAGINTNETLYMIRHAEAHPQGSWDDGNYIGAGQWRALDLPNALQGKISPNQVYSIDPAQFIAGTASPSGNSNWSYVRPALTVEPYAIANNLPFNLAASFEIFAANSPQSASDFFFQGGNFSRQSVLLAWEHSRIPTTVNALIASYFPKGGAPTVPGWPDGDYDTIWTVTLDASGNLTVNNSMCEGIQSAALPAAAPQF